MRVFILKPDAIGDFILASGCIRLIAGESGEENLVLAVRSDIAPLAIIQFPKALVLPLTLREKRRILNVTTVNILHSLPSWLWMLGLRADAALCLRSMRAYLHTISFSPPRQTPHRLRKPPSRPPARSSPGGREFRHALFQTHPPPLPRAGKTSHRHRYKPLRSGGIPRPKSFQRRNPPFARSR